MSPDNDIARLNVLLELFSEAAPVHDVPALLRIFAARVRWVFDFERLTLLHLSASSVSSYWTLTRDDERLTEVTRDQLPELHRTLIHESLHQRLPRARTGEQAAICHPLEASERPIGAFCISSTRTGYNYRDIRLGHHLAQFLAGTLDRLGQTTLIARQTDLLTSAEGMNRTKDEFLAMLGHELRNPLAPIVTAIELLEQQPGHVSSRELEVIKRHTAHVVRLVDDLLDVSRLSSGKIELRFATLDLRDILDRAVEATQSLIKQRRHELRLDVHATDLRVSGDENRLVQVFANLLSNAARFTEAGGHIHVVARREADDVVVDVIDDGLGIAPASLPQLFLPFVQGKQSSDRTVGGLGLGLAMVMSLTQLHHGTVTAVSAGVGSGSRFTIRLPHSAGEQRVSAPATVAAAAAASSPAHGLRVLIVDDNEDAAEMLGDVLAYAGHEIAIANDAEGALAKLDSVRPDAAILDIGLPGMDGYGLAREIRTRLGPATPYLIALTGYGQPDDHLRSREAGFGLHLVKPVNVKQVLGALDSTSRARPA